MLSARLHILNQIAAGHTTLAAALVAATTDPVIAGTKISQLVAAQPGYGPTAARAVLQQTGITVGQRVAGITAHQHQALVEATERAQA